MDTTENKVKHTPGPWIVSPYGYPFEKSCPALIWSQKTINGNQKHIANVLDRIPYHGTNEIGYHLISVEEKNANAEFIVRACNSHYEYLKCLKMIDRCLRNGVPIEENDPIHEILKNLLTK